MLYYEEQKAVELIDKQAYSVCYDKSQTLSRIRRVLTEKEIIDQANKQIQSLNRMIKSIEEVLNK